MSRFIGASLVLLVAACSRSPEGTPGVASVPAPAVRAAMGGDAMPNAVIVTPTETGDRPYFEFQVSRQVEPLGIPLQPQYPVALRSAGASGEVLIQFVVDTTGHVEPAGIRVFRSSHDLFSLAVRELLPRLRFRPAELEGRKVRQWVQQPFVFSLPNR